MDGQDEITGNFIAITGADHASARSILEVTGYDLEQAVGLYFIQNGDDGAVAKRANAGSGHQTSTPQASEVAPSGSTDAEVRAPLPVLRDRLYGADLTGLSPPRGAPQRERNQVDAFRDFRPEGYGGRGTDEGTSSQSQGLAGLFEPPHDILFQGTFDEAKEAAQGQSRWLLVNVQSNSEFASHMLNRDVWRDETMKNIIRVGFILYQVQDGSEPGNKVKAFYRLVDLPVIMVIDPITGLALRTWTGALEAHRLLEELVPFMDHGIDDPKALQMSSSHHRRKQPAAKAHEAEPMTEDEELAMALAMSAETSQPSPSAPAPGAAQTSASASAPRAAVSKPVEAPASSMSVGAPAMPASSESMQGSQASKKDPKAAMDEAGASLPPEPAAGDAGACSIAVRFPDGQRRQRRYPKDAPLSAVAAFCLASSEEAAGGRPFALTETFPGAPALEDMSKSLSDARLANAMLVMRWRS